MPTQLSLRLAGSHRDFLSLRMSTNPFSATAGPLPRLNIPLEARLTDREIEVEILRLLFDLKPGNTVAGQGEIGPITYLSTDDRPSTAVAPCPREALPYLVNPQPGQGRVTMQLDLGGLLRYRHHFPKGDERARGLEEQDVWNVQSIGEKGTYHLEVQVARSDWYEHVVAQLGIGGLPGHAVDAAAQPASLEVHARPPRSGGAGDHADRPARRVRPLPCGARRHARRQG